MVKDWTYKIAKSVSRPVTPAQKAFADPLAKTVKTFVNTKYPAIKRRK